MMKQENILGVVIGDGTGSSGKLKNTFQVVVCHILTWLSSTTQRITLKDDD